MAWSDTTSDGYGTLFVSVFAVLRAFLCHLPTKQRLLGAM